MYVYFLYCSHGDTHWVKIGKTTKVPWMRITELQTGNPLRIGMVGVLRKSSGERMSVAERRYQKVFFSSRVRGEWFALGPQQFSRLSAFLSKHGDAEAARVVPMSERRVRVRFDTDGYAIYPPEMATTA
jgi:hypothetical protein